MSHYDEQPDGDPHGECAAEIHRLQKLADSEGTRAVEYLRRARAAEAENARLRAALVLARENLEHWSGYASPYTRAKWNLDADLAAIDAALKGEQP